MGSRTNPWKVVTVTLMLAVFLPLGLAPSAGAGDPPPGPPPEPARTGNPWIYDQDGDGVDDRIQNRVGQVSVAVPLASAPTPEALDALRAEGLAISYVSPSIDVVFGTLQGHDLGRLAARPDVVRVEWDEPVYTLNQIQRQATQVQASATYADGAWQAGLTGQGVVIAILDTGVNTAHECLTGTFIGGFNAMTSPGVEANPTDGQGHGTHVACTALGHGGNPTTPFGPNAGAAPGARLVDIKVLGDDGGGSVESVTRGIDWAIANKDRDWGAPGYTGIQIISLSLGTSCGFGSGSDGTDALSMMVNKAAEEGLIATVAAGNDGRTGCIPSPGAAGKAITVGAVNDRGTVDRGDDAVASFSNCGPRRSDGDANSLDRLKPEVVAPGVGITSARHDGNTAYRSLSGTSMSTPHVAGIAALVLQGTPGLDWQAMKRVLALTAEDRGEPGYDPCWGFGYVNAFAAVSVDPSDLNFRPTARFATNGLPFVDRLLTFTSTSFDLDGTLVRQDWTFGDGATASGTVVTHTFLTPGAFTVTLEVEDDAGAIATATQELTITDAVLASFMNNMIFMPLVALRADGEPDPRTRLEWSLTGPNGEPLDDRRAVQGRLSTNLQGEALLRIPLRGPVQLDNTYLLHWSQDVSLQGSAPGDRIPLEVRPLDILVGDPVYQIRNGIATYGVPVMDETGQPLLRERIQLVLRNTATEEVLQDRTVTVNRDGFATFRIRGLEDGTTYSIATSYAGSRFGTFLADTSGPAPFLVQTQTPTLAPGDPYLNRLAYFPVSLEDKFGNGLQGRILHFAIVDEDTDEVLREGRLRTGRDGSVELRFRPMEPGSYYIEFTFPGEPRDLLAPTAATSPALLAP